MLLVVPLGAQIRCPGNRSRNDFDAVIVVFRKGEDSIFIIKLEHVGDIVVVTEEVSTEPSGLPVDIDSLD